MEHIVIVILELIAIQEELMAAQTIGYAVAMIQDVKPQQMQIVVN